MREPSHGVDLPPSGCWLLLPVEQVSVSFTGAHQRQLLGIRARRVNVVTDTSLVSYGKRQGARISIVTASGRTVCAARRMSFCRTLLFDARNYFDQAGIPEFQRSDFGPALDGSLRRDIVSLRKVRRPTGKT